MARTPFIAATVAATAVAAIAVATRSGEVPFLDHRVRRAMRRHDERWLDEIADSLGVFGEPPTQIGVSAAVSAALLYLWRDQPQRRMVEAVTPFAATVTASGIQRAIKLVYHRKRPLDTRLTRTRQPSFPSGHAAATAALAASVAMLLLRDAGRRPRRAGRSRGPRIVGASALSVIPLCVGAARVYVGRHWASDVVGGWILGCGSAAAVRGALYGAPSTAQRNPV